MCVAKEEEVVVISSEDENAGVTTVEPEVEPPKLLKPWKLLRPDPNVVAERKTVLEYAYSTHIVRREQVAPLPRYEQDQKDGRNMDGEAGCRTPSPVRNGFRFDPIGGTTDYSKYDRSEVEFHWRRQNTVHRRAAAKSEEETCHFYGRPPHSTTRDESA